LIAYSFFVPSVRFLVAKSGKKLCMVKPIIFVCTICEIIYD
jgi:hypothetical protein